MRIGIITHNLSYNYGGILQNYAMQTVLRRMGHTPITLNQNPHRPFNLWQWLKALPKRFFYKYYLRIPRIQLFEAFFANKNWRLIMQNLQPFIDKNISYIIVNDYEKLNQEDFDVILERKVLRPQGKSTQDLVRRLERHVQQPIDRQH